MPLKNRSRVEARAAVGVEESPTRRLEPRATSANDALRRNAASAVNDLHPAAVELPQKRRAAVALILVMIVVVAVGIVSWATLIRPKSQTTVATVTSNAFFYPGAQTILDTTNDGGRTIQLETGDSLDHVVAWYTATLKPMKTLQLTSTTTVLRNQNVTATIVAQDNKTTILIKQLAP